MNGLETLRELRKTYPKLPVIMFSTLTQRGAAETLDALALGASDYVTKPANVGSVTEAIEAIRREMVPRIRALCAPAPHPAAPSFLTAPSPRVPPRLRTAGRPDERIDIVAIGVSTGGPNTLAEILAGLPADFPVPIVIVQHMPPIFTKILAERLDAVCPLQVQEGRPGGLVEPGRVWLAAGGSHMVVIRRNGRVYINTNEDPPENSCRPAVDVLFRSVVPLYGHRTLGVVLTGMGQDGLRGSEDIKAAGGRILVQDQPTSVVWGMPGYVYEAGLADKVLPKEEIAAEIVNLVRRARPQPKEMVRA